MGPAVSGGNSFASVSLPPPPAPAAPSIRGRERGCSQSEARDWGNVTAEGGGRSHERTLEMDTHQSVGVTALIRRQDELQRGQSQEAQVCQMPESRGHLLAQGSQEKLQVQGLRVRQVQPHPGEAACHGSSGSWFMEIHHKYLDYHPPGRSQEAAGG